MKHAAFCLLAWLLAAALLPAQEPKRPAVGQVAPVFEAKATDGTTVSLADLRGKVVLLNVWASY